MELKFKAHIERLNSFLKITLPRIFGPELIKIFLPDSYFFFCGHLQLKNGDVDWDLLTICFDKSFQKRWRLKKGRNLNSYSGEEEVREIFNSYSSKLYTLTIVSSAEDKIIRDRILTRLVRTAQRGNESARQQVVLKTNFMIYDWMENSKYMARWRGYESEMERTIESCIRNFQYSGSFCIYLYMTLYYSARGLRQTQSLDASVGKTRKRRIDFVVAASEEMENYV